jgi:predicted heme/steroid binding protein
MTDNLPNKEISVLELKRNTGERGARMWVAHQGIVYDVTDCARWRTGLHENLHFPGQDLTTELDEDSPHKEVIFKHPCVKVVGRLQK